MSYSYAIIIGYLCNLKTYGWGYTFSIREPRRPGQETVFHNVAVKGATAVQMRSHLEKGAHLELRCSINYVKKDAMTYTNFTAITCKVLPKPAKKSKPNPPEFDDDYFVPTVNHTQTRAHRRYEGFTTSY